MKRLWTVAALLGCVFPSYADVSGLYVEYYSLSNPHDHWAAVAGFPDRHLSQAGLPSESNIALTNLTSQVYRIVAATPSTTDVGATTIACASPTSTPSILIAGSINSPVNLITRSGTRPAAAVRSLQGVSCSSGRPKLQISASGSIFGVIDMYDIARINIGGSLGTSCVITHDPIYDSELGPWPEIGEITCAYAFTGSSIVLVHGGLGYIESLGQLGSSIWVGKGDIGGIRAITISETLRGAIRGDITTELGGIENIEADYEIGGANGSIINIKTKNGINNIFGSGIRANIIANAFGGSGNIGRIQTTNVIAGQIAAQTLTKVGDDPAIAILSGNLDADITLQGDLASKIVIAGELNPTRTIKVYGDIVSGGSVTVGVGGLKGQVIINGSGGSNTWDGSIKVGPDGDPGQIVLAPPTSAPYYSRTPAELGGGAVGLAPFHVHPAGSTITNGGYYFRPGSPTDALPNPFRIRHYGLFQMASTPKVQVRDPYNASVWGDVTHLFTVVRENDPNSTLPRTLKITYMGRNGVPIPPGALPRSRGRGRSALSAGGSG